MSRIGSALYELRRMEASASEKSFFHLLHPLNKLFLTIIYITVVVSIHRYDILSLVLLGVYPGVAFILGKLSWSLAFKRLKFILPFVACVGILNPFFDSQLITICGLSVRGGFISLFTLFLKGLLTVLATYSLIATTSIEKICYGLKVLRIPSIIITQILLTYRYLHLLLEESHRVTQAYELRAPSSTGIAFSEWGSLLGKFLLRSVDRAEQVYNSMLLRGFRGDFTHCQSRVHVKNSDLVFFVIWILFFALVKIKV